MKNSQATAERDRFATELQSARSISSAENTRLSAELRKARIQGSINWWRNVTICGREL